MTILSLERLSACAILLCVVTLGYFFDWRYQCLDLIQARIDAAQLQMQINTMRQISVHLTQYQSQYVLAQKTLQQILTVFPNVTEFNAQLKNLIMLGKRQGVQFIEIKPSSIINKNLYLQIPVKIEFLSHQQQFLNFIQQAASTKIILAWGEWIFSKYPKGKRLAANDQGLLLYKTTAVFYYIK